MVKTKVEQKDFGAALQYNLSRSVAVQDQAGAPEWQCLV